MDKFLKMKPKEYRNVSKKEKKEIKKQYEYEKAKKEVYEEEIKNLEKMVPLDYLSILNSETKEKLIGLCLNRKFIESSQNFLILILMVFLLKLLFDFKSMGGFNYPLLVKLLYMIILISALIIILHPEEMKKAVKQTKLDDYFQKKIKIS